MYACFMFGTVSLFRMFVCDSVCLFEGMSWRKEKKKESTFFFIYIYFFSLLLLQMTDNMNNPVVKLEQEISEYKQEIKDLKQEIKEKEAKLNDLSKKTNKNLDEKEEINFLRASIVTDKQSVAANNEILKTLYARRLNQQSAPPVPQGILRILFFFLFTLF